MHFPQVYMRDFFKFDMDGTVYSHKDNLEVHRYFSVCVEPIFCLFCKLFLSTHHLGLRGLQ